VPAFNPGWLPVVASGNGEIVAMLRQVRRFLETHGEGRFSMWHRGSDDHAPKTLNRAGVRRMLGSGWSTHQDQ
jgi:putative DNA primase/helicase